MDRAPAGTLRERKKARTRDALVDTATALFRSKGFEATTIDDIVEPVEVSRRTFFRYFPSKESIAFPRHADQIATFRALVAEHADPANPFRAVRAAALGLAAEYMSERRALLEQARMVDASPALHAQERKLDAEWEQTIAETLTPPRASAAAARRARVLAGATMGAFRATLREWFDGDVKEDLVALGRDTLDALEAGFTAGRGS